jgi:galactonate dehydratase
MAEPYYISLAPHCPGGPIVTAVSMQIAACTPNFLILEHGIGGDKVTEEIVKDPPKLKEGYYHLSSKPGLGIDLKEESFGKHPFRPRTILPHLGYDDGTIFGEKR